MWYTAMGIDKFYGLNFRTAPYFIMHAGHCLKENNGKNNVRAMELCAVFVVSWWWNKGLHTLNRMHNEVWAVRKFSHFMYPI